MATDDTCMCLCGEHEAQLSSGTELVLVKQRASRVPREHAARSRTVARVMRTQATPGPYRT